MEAVEAPLSAVLLRSVRRRGYDTVPRTHALCGHHRSCRDKEIRLLRPRQPESGFLLQPAGYGGDLPWVSGQFEEGGGVHTATGQSLRHLSAHWAGRAVIESASPSLKPRSQSCDTRVGQLFRRIQVAKCLRRKAGRLQLIFSNHHCGGLIKEGIDLVA